MILSWAISLLEILNWAISHIIFNLSNAGGDVFASSILSFFALFAAERRAFGFVMAGRSFSAKIKAYITFHLLKVKMLPLTWFVIVIIFLSQ